MQRYSNAEKADIHYMYGAANGNAVAAQRLYRERFPQRPVPDRRIFQRVHRQLCETGSFHADRRDAGCSRTVRTPHRIEAIVDDVDERPDGSTRAMARSHGVSHMTVWRVLHEEHLHPYHLHGVQALQEADYPRRVTFARWYLQQCTVQPQFAASVLFTDEATFTRDGMFNTHNEHVWATSNPHATRVRCTQQRFSVNVWAGILHDYIIGPYLLPDRLNGATYLVFLQQVLPELLAVVPRHLRATMWFQHDGAPAHYTRDVRNYLNTQYPNRWIGRGAPIAWPPRSPDLSSLDYFFWGHLKSLVYETPVDSPEDLVARIIAAAGDVRDMPGIFETVRQSLRRRCEACLTVGGRSFEQLL